MSAIAKVSVRESASGTVAVTVGDGSSKASVVDGGKSTPIQVRFLATDNGRAEVLLDPYGEPVNLSGLLLARTALTQLHLSVLPGIIAKWPGVLSSCSVSRSAQHRDLAVGGSVHTSTEPPHIKF